MNLSLPSSLGANYISRSQIARVVTEEWGARNLYCPACTSDSLIRTPSNTRAVDYYCPACNQQYQLKSGQRQIRNKISDAGYEAMVVAIRSNNSPNLFIMHYSSTWQVRNLVLVPSFFFTETIIERRKPLGSHTRRSGWVGCNIIIRELPIDGKLSLVQDGNVIDQNEVRRQYRRVQPLAQLDISRRGWTLDVLKVIRRIGKTEFSLDEVYAFEFELGSLHPDNNNVRPKIRQQLQTLRDLGLLDFEGRGRDSVYYIL